MKSTLNESVRNVIESELKALVPNLNIDQVKELNDKFLSENQNSFECVFEASKLVFDLNPSENQKEIFRFIDQF